MIGSLLHRLIRAVGLTPADDRGGFEARLAVGRLAAQTQRAHPPASLREAEFRTFSQFGEDGILQFLVRRVGPLPETFVEFGVQDYTEANTLFLLLAGNWRGLILDGSAAAIRAVRGRDLFWRHDLTAVAAFVTRENINGLLTGHGFVGEIGVLSVDIDGNDYWVWEAITAVDPGVVVVEYNSLFGPTAAVTVPYDPAFLRTRAHHSNLYWGSSLAALGDLGERKGYALVGCNSNGNNAFFVRRDRVGDLPVVPPGEAFVRAKFRESRDKRGRLTFLPPDRQLDPIGHLPVWDVRSGREVSVREAVSG